MGGIISRWSTSKARLPPNEDVKDEDPVLTRTLDFAWVTLATNDSYSLGALVLAHSLRNANTVHKLAVLVTPAVSTLMREQLSTVFDLVKVVDVLDSKDEAHLALLRRPELGVTFTKLHCWRLTEFEKCVFLDADTLVIRNCDELFEREELSAAPDVGWPDCFNTGVFVYKPSTETFNNLMKLAMEQGSFDGGDQGLLNQYFDDWATKDIKKHLPFVYNLTSVAVYSYIPAFKRYGSDVRIVHFIGTGKPWLQQLNPSTRTVNPAPGADHLAPLLQMWWDIFCEKVHPSMSTNLECDSGMGNDEREACANNVSLDTEPAEFIQPFTCYTYKDDSRQVNLPYHPFDVKSSSGELLNITYLEQRERDILEEMSSERSGEQERREQEKNYFVADDGGIKEEELKKISEQGGNEYKEVEDKEREEVVKSGKVDTETEMESPVSEEKLREPQKEEEKELTSQEEQPSFDCNTFFPDEICVQNYLEKNFHAYQTQGSENKNANFEVPQENLPLPRFLTMAEDDQRQSLNVCYEEPSPLLSSSTQLAPTQNALSEDCPSSEKGVGEAAIGKESQENFYTSEAVPEVQTTKTAPSSEDNLLPAKSAGGIPTWKSHINVRVDPNKKYSMPKLKPLLPKQNVSYETVSEARQKITQYTEFHMNCDHGDFVPCDKLGFIERHILEEVKINEMDKDMKLKTLSYIFPQGKNVNKENKVDLVPPESFDEMTDYDLSLCQRQKGNQPVTSLKSKRNSRGNSCFLPVLKPLKPSKGFEMGRRLSSNGSKSKDRGARAKVESRKAREKAKTEIKSHVQSTSVEDVLKRLISFSKGYQKYFTGFTAEKKKSDIAVSPNIIKIGYNELLESPTLQYNKEFENNIDTGFGKVFPSKVSPGGSSAKYNGEYSATNYAMATKMSPVTEVIAEDEKTKEEAVEEFTVRKRVDLGFSERPARLRGDNGYQVESSESEREGDLTRNALPVDRRNMINGENGVNKSVTTLRENPITLVTEGERTLQTVLTRSISPERKTKKRQRRSAMPKKDEVQRPADVTVSTPFAPPRSSATESVAKLSNIFTELPEDFSDDTASNTGKTRSVSRRPGKTFSQTVREKSEGTRKVKVAPSVDSGINNSGIAGAIAKLSLQSGGLPGTESEAARSAQEDYIRRQNWEMGTMDYMGRDSFNNIWSKICETLDEKVPHDFSLDKELTKNKSSAPPEKTETDSLIPGKIQIEETPEKMIAEKERTEEDPPQADEKVAGTAPETSSKAESSGSDLPSKASQALEAFGKLFISGPVVIKSEESQDVSKPSDTSKSESLNDKKEQAGSEEVPGRKKSLESDEEGKKKKGVLSKILELVGVEQSATPTSVFYDTEESTTKSQNMGSSVFYDNDYGQGSPSNLNVAEEVSTQLKQRPSSPSLQLKTTPGTEIVPPTPPPTPLTDKVDKIPPKDDKYLVADETIMETPPVTDKKILEEVCDKEAVKSEVENIIETAVQYAQEQLNRTLQEDVSSKTEKLSSTIPKANEALEAFGKLFISGPVTIKSEVVEDVPKSLEATEKGKLRETTADETEKDRAGKVNIVEAAQDIVSTKISLESIPKPADAETSALAEKAKQAEIYSTKDAEVSSMSAQTPQEVTKPEESLTEAVLSESVPDSQAKDIDEGSEPSKRAEVTQEHSQKPGESEKPSVSTEKSAALPEPIQDTLTKSKEQSSEVTLKLKELQPELAEKANAQEKSSPPTEPPVAPLESIPDTLTKPEGESLEVCGVSEEKRLEICLKIDEAVPETSPKSTEKEADAVVKGQDTSSKFTPGDSSDSAPLTKPALEEDSLKKLKETSSIVSQVPSQPEEESRQKESVQSQSLPSKASEALEVFGKVFTSGPVVLKSDVPENRPEPAKVEEKVCSSLTEVTSREPLEAFGKVFVSGPVTIKSEVEETDAVHPVFQTKPEEEPIYCNIDEVEEIKVTSEEDRKKEKPQSSKLTEQILRAIPPQDRKPFTEASSVSSEVSQLLASIEPQNVSILLDKPMTDEMVTAEEDSASVPPVPPRRNRSKGRDAPLPPPKKKGKNDKS